MLVRVGIPERGGALVRAAADIAAPVLVSANRYWDDQKRRWKAPSPLLQTLDVALDSSGFVAMVLYRRYRWTVSEYVSFAASYPWAWWAQMDFCCEAEIARNRDEVRRRIGMTVEHLSMCRDEADRIGCRHPVPVLQGREPEDYVRCAEAMGDLPAMVGVGSVCRRNLNGREGLYRVIYEIDRHLPKGVQLHLFGVKGAAIAQLGGNDRIASIDSMAWDDKARWEGKDKDVNERAKFMRGWYFTQRALLVKGKPEPSLFDRLAS